MEPASSPLPIPSKVCRTCGVLHKELPDCHVLNAHDRQRAIDYSEHSEEILTIEKFTHVSFGKRHKQIAKIQHGKLIKP